MHQSKISIPFEEMKSSRTNNTICFLCLFICLFVCFPGFWMSSFSSVQVLSMVVVTWVIKTIFISSRITNYFVFKFIYKFLILKTILFWAIYVYIYSKALSTFSITVHENLQSSGWPIKLPKVSLINACSIEVWNSPQAKPVKISPF